MSTAFPTKNQTDPFRAGAAAMLIPERGVHIPAAYVRNPHADADNTKVTQNGIPLLGADKKPFVVSQVLPERRWAILEGGELMPQVGFDALKKQGVYEFYETLRQNGSPEAKYTGNVDREPIPDVAYYVRWTVDPMDEEKVLEIGYDPNATDGAVVKTFHDNKGEEIMASRLDILTQAYASKAGRDQMTAAERKEVELYLGIEASAGTDGVAAKLEMLTDLHGKGDLDDKAYLSAVSALTGSGGVEPADIPPKPEEVKVSGDEATCAPVAVSVAKQPTTALCGKADCKGEVGKKAHERRCKKCQEIAAEG